MLFSQKTERTRFAKFLVVGAISSVIDFGFMNLFLSVFKLPLIISQAFSFIIAVLGSFMMNRFWIYRDSRSRNPFIQLTQFVLINLVGIGIRSILIPLFHKLFLPVLINIFNWDDKIITLFSQNLSLAIVIGIVLLWNFFANRYWTYSDVKIGTG